VVTFTAMTTIINQLPFPMVSVATIGLLAAAVLTLLLGWHALRRLFDIPRVPRPAGMYVTLGALWIALVTFGAMSAGTMVLLRDHQRVDARTPLADVRCEAVSPGHVRAEVRTSPSAAPEHYDFAGDTCIVGVRQVELRRAIGLLGVRVLSRIESVGPVRRPVANPEWKSRRVVDLVARRTEAISVAVPADAQVHSVLASSLHGPTLAQNAI
jgi:hypothetical protein